MNAAKHYVRLPLKNAGNVRELGGHPCAKGSVTKWRAFLRGDDLSMLTEEEVSFLLDYGVRTVIDLRSHSECKAHPDPFAQVAAADYCHMPLGLDDVDDVTKMQVEDTAKFICKFYLDILGRQGASLQQILSRMANAREGCVLFHCSAGKDRTGILAALLLTMAGVSRGDIAANYEITYSYLKQSPRARQMLGHYPEGLARSDREYIEAVLDYIEEAGGIDAYLTYLGLTEENKIKLQMRICD